MVKYWKSILSVVFTLIIIVNLMKLVDLQAEATEDPNLPIAQPALAYESPYKAEVAPRAESPVEAVQSAPQDGEATPVPWMVLPTSTPGWVPPIAFDGSMAPSYTRELMGSAVIPPRPVMDFTFPSTTGQDFTLSSQRGKVVMMYFGYLTCPDVCPTTMADMMRAYRDLGEPADKVTVLFVTIDPERDTLEYMTRYVQAFNPNFIGVRPNTQADVDALLESFGVIAQRREVDSAAGYLIDHSASVLILSPDGRLVDQLPFGVQYTEIVNDLDILMYYTNLGRDTESIMGEVVVNDPSREYRIVIPAGAGEMIRMGRDPGVIPLDIRLKIGELDILVLENNDSEDYLVGGIWVAPNETVKKQFFAPQTFEGMCTVTVGRDLVSIIVE